MMTLIVLDALHDLGVEVDAEFHEYATSLVDDDSLLHHENPDMLFRLCVHYRPPKLGNRPVRYVAVQYATQAERENPRSVILPVNETGEWSGLVYIPREE